MSKDRTTKTTVSLYPVDETIISQNKDKFKEDEVVFNLSEFLRFCLRSKNVTEIYMEKVKLGHKY